MAETLRLIAKEANLNVFDIEFARFLTERDELKYLRNEFCYPKMGRLPKVDPSLVNPEDDSIYLCGNSLGLQPKCIKKHIDEQLEKWATHGVFGHMQGALPWAECDEFGKDGNATLVGAYPDEIGLMNSLTVNLHILMLSFYQPTATRFKILLEKKAFPSDHYAIESQAKLRGFDPKDVMICLEPRASEGESFLRTEDILKAIEEHGDSIAMVMLSGVQYYTGQFFDMPTITKAAKKRGCVVGWDLAHAVANVPLHLHDWDVDFAAWCTYKYMCGGAGAIGGLFIHRQHHETRPPTLVGWWGHKADTRFVMDNVLNLAPGPDGYRISNPPMLLMVAMMSSLEVLGKTSMAKLREKSLLLTGYLELLVRDRFCAQSPNRTTATHCTIVTPSNADERGCQLSLEFVNDLSAVFVELEKRGVAVSMPLHSCDMENTSTAKLREKSLLLTGLVRDRFCAQSPNRTTVTHCTIVTPSNADERGCQLSHEFVNDLSAVFVELEKRGVAVSMPLHSCDMENTSTAKLREKSLLLTGLVRDRFCAQSPNRTTATHCTIVTPSNADERGCQLSLEFVNDLSAVFVELEKRGVAVSMPLHSCDMENTSTAKLREKSLLLTGLVRDRFCAQSPNRTTVTHCTIVTPSNADERGCQLSHEFVNDLSAVFVELEKRGVAVSMPLHSCDMENTSTAKLREKSLLLTGLVRDRFCAQSPNRTTVTHCTIVTPSNADERGCQLSLEFVNDLSAVFVELEKRGVACDVRSRVIRVAPVHLYNNFVDVHRFCSTLQECLSAIEKKLE